MATKCYYALYATLGLSLITDKILIYKTVIRPVILYGSETWCLIKQNERQLVSGRDRCFEKFSELLKKMEIGEQGRPIKLRNFMDRQIN